MTTHAPSRAGGFFPKRTIHLDFHTGPDVPDVGSRFDPERFGDTFLHANVDSVTLFAKCHHGHLYYDTDRPERHPGLSRELNLLERQVEALHAHGIRTPIYISVQCDEYAANSHPEWVAMDGLAQVKWSPGPFAAGWQILDMSSPYQEYLAEQVQEVLDRFAPVDGLFLDMCWDQPSTSKWARAGMKELGLNPASEADRDVYAREVAHRYMARFSAMATPYFADDVASGVWFNSRPKTALGEEAAYLRHVEIEALPTGGWGYSYFPYTARYVRPLGLPTLSHTGRFFKSWGDNGGLKPRSALRYETAQILSQGMTVGIGDLLAPSGRADPATYELVGDAYGHAEACEPFLAGTVVAAEAALVVDPRLGDHPGPSGIGAMRGLQRAHVQFDIVGPEADLAKYALVVVPETTALDDELAARLSARASQGGSVLLSRGYDSGRDESAQLSQLGFELQGPLPARQVFLRPRPGLVAVHFDHVIYQQGIAIKAPGADVLCDIVEPYFPRTWDHFSGHSYTPSSGVVSGWPAIVQNGSLILTAVPLLTSIASDAAPFFSNLAGGLIGRLLPRPMVRAGGPAHLETTLAVGPESMVLHVISYVASRATEGLETDPVGAGDRGPSPIDLIEDPFPVIDVPIEIDLCGRSATSVRSEPEGIDLPFTVSADGYLSTSVTVLDGHAMVVARLA